MVIVDTSVWIDLLNRKPTPETEWLRHGRNGRVVGLTTLILTEVLQGIRFDERYRQAESHLRMFPVIDGLSTQTALRAAQNYRTLRSMGITIRSTVDCVIATICLESGHILLHIDRDFDHFERHLGLNVLRPENATR